MKIFTNFSIKLLLLFFILNVALSSCKKKNSGEIVKGEVKIKVVNAAQSSSDQEVYVDDAKLMTTALAFSEMSDYIKIASGSRNISFSDSGDAVATSFNFTPSITYTTFLVSNRGGVKEIVSYEDNLSNTDAGKAKIKLINLSPYFSTGVNVSVQGGTQFVNGLLYKEASTYFTLDAGMNLRFNVVGSGSIKTVDGANLIAGKIYTIWFSGTTAAALEAHIITDN